MRKPFIIGSKEYKFKKDAITHYQTILNSYDFGQSVNDSDFDDLIDLLDYDYVNYLSDIEILNKNIYPEPEITDSSEISEVQLTIEDIKIAKVQFNTKCFEIFYSDKSSLYMSYLMIINKTKYNPEKLFRVACRNAVQNDIRLVKQSYFDVNSAKGQVKCQETGTLSKWTELVVDHRQPNTFSIIIDRFKEINKIDLEIIEYISNDQNQIIFQDDSWADSFKQYHKEKASLRIVRTECNSSRSAMARVKRTTKDLTIK